MISQKIKVGKKYITALSLKLGQKSLVVLAGKNGYIMCGYLDLGAAEQCRDLAVKITGVSTIEQALDSKVHSYTSAAGARGVYEGQSVRDVLEIIV